MNDIYTRLYQELLKSGDLKIANADKKYHKYDNHKSLGIRAPLLNTILKKYRKEILSLTCAKAINLAGNLYQTEIEESILTGNYVLKQKIDCLSDKDLLLLDASLNYFHSWSTIDDFCIHVLQPLLIKHPKKTISLLRKWNKDDNMWKRRASVVVFARKAGASGEFTDEALALCENLIWDKEDLVQKGVGWCLKDIMRGDKKKVTTYVKELRKKGVSSTITLYAIRDLKGSEREEVLQ